MKLNNRFLFYNKNKYLGFFKIVAIALTISTITIKSISSRTLIQNSNSGTSFQVNEIIKDLGIPWGMTFISQKEIMITERNGKIGILNTKSGKIVEIEGAPKVFSYGQGGLLDVAVPSNYKKGDWIFFTYSKEYTESGRKKAATSLARAKLEGYRLIKFSDLLVTKSGRESSIHFGSRITFDGNGNIFFSVGDRGNRLDAQNLSLHSGSILRLKLNGHVPKDNPLLNKKGVLPEIWSFGHRNPQGIFYDKEHDRLWSIEHGPRGGDEINLIKPGRNYGWPIISYGKEYWGPIQVGEGTEKEGMEQPKKFYVPSIAPGSLIVYSGKAFPSWKGSLFAGALKLRHLNRIQLDKGGTPIYEERLLVGLRERIRSILESQEGWIYFSTDSGKIMEIIPYESNN